MSIGGNVGLAQRRSLHKIIETCGGFPNEEAAFTLLFLALRQAAKRWTRRFITAGSLESLHHSRAGPDAGLGESCVMIAQNASASIGRGWGSVHPSPALHTRKQTRSFTPKSGHTSTPEDRANPTGRSGIAFRQQPRHSPVVPRLLEPRCSQTAVSGAKRNKPREASTSAMRGQP